MICASLVASSASAEARVVIVEFRHRLIAATRRFYRGDSVAEGARCASNGIQSTNSPTLPDRFGNRGPNESAYGAVHLPPVLPTNVSPGLLAVLAVQDVSRHVNEKRGPSPFVSFAEKLAIARSWATNHGGRAYGAVIEVVVQLSSIWCWRSARARYAFAYQDNCDRVWLRTQSYWALLEELVAPAAMAEMRTRGLFDAEWLLLRGTIPASSLVVQSA